MRIIISPAKKMRRDIDSLDHRGLPEFLPRAKELRRALYAMSYEELKKLWACNDRIAILNYERLREMELEFCLTPAILAYDGIQYQYMAPGVFTNSEFEYVQEHLRILSGFYGMLKPFDGVQPYRLEMQAKLSVGGSKNLYDFWGDSLAKRLSEETDCLIDLASKEYSMSVIPHLTEKVRVITCIFGEEKEGRVIEKSTMCKMARGEMVRYMAENNITKPEDIKSFDRLRYSFSPCYSADGKYVFIHMHKISSHEFQFVGAFSLIEGWVYGVEVFLVHFLHSTAQTLAEALIMDHLTFAQEADNIVYIRVIAETEDIVIGDSGFLFWYDLVSTTKIRNSSEFQWDNRAFRGFGGLRRYSQSRNPPFHG